MREGSEIAILAPNVVRSSPLPRRWKKRGAFRELGELDESGLLARALGIDARNIAAAPLHYLGMTGNAPDGYCLFAFPVYLHARREQLVLMTGEDFELSEAESRSVMAALEEYFPHWRIERTRDAMWFILVDQDPDLATTPLQAVLGEDINEHLPRGGDAMEWVKALNEVQMILFDSEVNRKREAAGRPPVNSLWFWGGGRLPDIHIARWRQVVTNNPVAFGAARRAGIASRWLEEGLTDLSSEGPAVAEAGTLWVYSRPGGGGGESSALSTSQWDALREALTRRDIDRLVLIEPGHGELTISGRRRSWWPWR